MDGRFSLDAPKGAKLQISYIGYITKELTVDTKTDYVIELVEDSQALEEVVVVGYGTEKKVNVIGSIAQIGRDSTVVECPDWTDGRCDRNPAFGTSG